MKQDILERLKAVSVGLGIETGTIKLDYPENLEHGDFTSNVAMVNAKKLGMNPRVLAEKIVAAFQERVPTSIENVEIAGPGFINFKVKGAEFARAVLEVGDGFGRNNSEKRKEIMIEYTDPNTFKVFHIGHLMSNAIGESLSRLIEASGAQVIRICYPSDIGLHIAKSIWALRKHLIEMPADSAPIQERTAFLGNMYVEGTEAYEKDPAAKTEIDVLNKIMYEKSDPQANELYMKGRQWSLDHFELLYKRLGTIFAEYIFESEMAPVGLELVHKYLEKGIFEISDGAVVFKGEKYGLHTRVFINSQGLPTYEAKEMGLNTTKFKKHPKADQSIVITASEQNDYFKVVLKALSLIDANAGAKTLHIGHGMMRFQSGKMSSRTGKVITAESLLADIKELVAEKIADRQWSPEEADEIADEIAVGAIKYSILRSAPGGDIIFDSAASISFEGDSGPYLQYAAVRAARVLEKSRDERSEVRNERPEMRDQKIEIFPERVGPLERLITRFPDVVARARAEYAPQIVANYLVNLASVFNSFYAAQTIIDEKDPLSPYWVAVTRAFSMVMTNGLWLLGIKVPKKM